MSVKLDWQIESEREAQRATEDPEARRKRRQQRALIALVTVMIAAAVVGAASAIALRLYTVDNKLRDSLSNAAHAEVAALRIGDQPGFMDMMQSMSKPWMSEQQARFQRYQELKTKSAIQLTGNVLDATVDGNRGRVQVEELLNGQRYVALWYFWRYTDGWRHVPSDLTFWGDTGQIEGSVSTIQYNGLDAALAQTIASKADRWWVQGCAFVGCGTPPHLTIVIVPDSTLTPQWAESYTLRLASPLASGDRAPLDPPLSADLEEALATQIADKLFDAASGQLPINANTDAEWLHRSIIDWLAASFAGHGDTARIGFMQTLADHYGGASAVSAIMKQLSTNSDIGIIATALNQPLDTLQVDWRPFFQWRLELEKILIANRNQPEFLALWEPKSALALKRWTAATQGLPQVQTVTLTLDSARGTLASVATLIDGQAVTVQFRLIGGSWKRIA